MKHEPSGFLRHAKIALNFVPRDAVFAFTIIQVAGSHFSNQEAVLKDRSDLNSRTAFCSLCSSRRDEAKTSFPDVLRTAARTAKRQRGQRISERKSWHVCASEEKANRASQGFGDVFLFFYARRIYNLLF